MRDLRMSGPYLTPILLLAVATSASLAQAQTNIPQVAAKTCAVMSGQRKADGQTVQYLLLLDQGLGHPNPVAIALYREVVRQCPKAYLNYQQRKRVSNPFPPGSLVNPGGSLTNPGRALTNPGGSLYRPGQGLVVSETEQEIRVAIAADLLFDFDKATIRPDAASALKQAAAVIREKNHDTVHIEGHTDSKGSNAYNLRLSHQRAIAVKTWLAQHEGFDVATFSTRGFGATRPVASNTKPDGSDNPDGRQLNRRVDLVIAK